MDPAFMAKQNNLNSRKNPKSKHILTNKQLLRTHYENVSAFII